MHTVAKILGVFDKAKSGQPFVTKKGDPYKKANVNFAGLEGKIVSVAIWQGETCEVGDEYEGIVESREYEGKTYYSFSGKKKEDKNAVEIAALKFSLQNAHRKIDEIVSFLKEKPWLKPVQTPLPPEVKAAQVETADEINPEDIPF